MRVRTAVGVVKTFIAQYRSQCGRCDQPIEPGETATYEDDEVVHAANCAESVELDGAGTVCRECNLIHAGECW